MFGLRRRKRDVQKTPGTSIAASSDVYEFQKAIEAKLRSSGGKLAIYKRSYAGAKPAYQGEMSLAEVASQDSFLTYLLQTRGNGEYVLQLQEPSGKYIREFIFALGRVGLGRTASDDDSGGGRSSSFKDAVELFKAFGEMFKPQGNGNWIEAVKAVNEMGKESRELNGEIMSVLLSNALSERSDPVEQTIRMVELAKTLQPNIEQQDGMTGLLQTAMLALMGRGGNPLAALNQIQKAAAEASPPGQGQGMQALASSPPAQAPGGGQVQDHRVVQQQGSSPPPGTSPGLTEAQQAFYNLTVLPFRQAVTAGVSPDHLGNMILGMVGTAKQWNAGDPHPLVKPLVDAATLPELATGFDAFCASIPELKRQPELQAKIKAYLGKILMEANPEQAEGSSFGEAAEPEGEEIEEDEDQDVYSAEDTAGDEGNGEPAEAANGEHTSQAHEDDTGQVGRPG